MSTRKWAAAIIFAAAFIALFIPFVPQTNSGGIPGAQYKGTAMMSPSYYVFHCGSYVNPNLTVEHPSGFQGFYQISKGYTFSCKFSSD